MADPCGGPQNLLEGQYENWWTSVFLTIAPGCWRIPVFSFVRGSGLSHLHFHFSQFLFESRYSPGCGEMEDTRKRRLLAGKYAKNLAFPECFTL